MTRLEDDPAEADLSCDIGTLTTVMLGYKRPTVMARYGRLTGNQAALEWLEAIIPQAETALFDHF